MSGTRRLVEAIEDGRRARGSAERAAGATRYLKSELESLGVATPEFRAVVGGALHSCGAVEMSQVRASGLTVREAVKHLPPERRAAMLDALRGTGRSGRGKRPVGQRRSGVDV